VELKGAFSKTASVSGFEAQRGSSSVLEARIEPKEPRTPVQYSRSRVGKVESKWSANNQRCTSKASHQNILEANQGDWQKELVVKTVVPRNCRELREFLKRANHYHCFVKNYTAVVQPLTVLTSPKVKWAWFNAQQQAFDNIKLKVRASLILAGPVNGKPFHLCTDTSDYAIRAVLDQEGKDGQWRVAAYGSCSLTRAERKWSLTEKECFGVVHCINHWQYLLLGAQDEVLTDQQALSKMFGQAESPKGKLARWVSKMQPFKPFNAKCWSGGNSDALSRELKTRQVEMIKQVKRTGNIEELREDPAFVWVLKALESSWTYSSKAATNQDNVIAPKMGMDLIGPLPKSKQRLHVGDARLH